MALYATARFIIAKKKSFVNSKMKVLSNYFLLTR